MRRAQKGFTLIEVMIASVITSLVAAVTLMAFVAAARMNKAQNNPQNAEAADYAQQTVERFRSNIACRQPGDPAGQWFDANCGSTLPVGWQDDPLPAVNTTGNRSFLAAGNLPAARRYCVTAANPADCTVGDCYAIQVRVCWNGTACPAIGAPCP